MRSTGKSILMLICTAALLLTGCTALQTRNFADLGDGTMRLRDSALQWQLERGPYFTSWDAASAYVAKLNLGGHSDWRLPTEDELLELYTGFDFGNPGKVGKTKEIKGYYWVAEDQGIGYVGAWKDGQICEISRDFTPGNRGGYVWAVRP